MSKSKHYSMATLLWNNTAYCDQWSKVMAVYDECDNLRAVIKKADEDEYYNVLLIGDDAETLFVVNGIELGATGKNLKSCFDIYCRLQHERTPAYTPSYRNVERVRLYEIFTHTRAGAKRHGGFRVTTDDISDRINDALKRYGEITSGDIEFVDCCDWDDRGSYPGTIRGYAGTMHHVGGGAYCDDDGDNWDFR